MQLALALASGTNIKDQATDETIIKTNSLPDHIVPLDPYIHHPDEKEYLKEIKALYADYRNELLEIISLYRFQDEIDLFCRFISQMFNFQLRCEHSILQRMMLFHLNSVRFRRWIICSSIGISYCFRSSIGKRFT